MVLHVVWTPVVFALRQRVWDWEGDRPVEPRPVHQTTRTSRRSSASTRASPSGSLCWSAAPKSHGADDAEPRPTRRSTMTNDCSQYFAGDAGDVVGALASEGGVADGSGAVAFESGRVRRHCGGARRRARRRSGRVVAEASDGAELRILFELRCFVVERELPDGVHPDEQHVSCRVCRDELERRDRDVNNRTIRQPRAGEVPLLLCRAEASSPTNVSSCVYVTLEREDARRVCSAFPSKSARRQCPRHRSSLL